MRQISYRILSKKLLLYEPRIVQVHFSSGLPYYRHFTLFVNRKLPAPPPQPIPPVEKPHKAFFLHITTVSIHILIFFNAWTLNFFI